MYSFYRRSLAGFGALVCALAVAPAVAQARKHAGPGGRHNVSINLSDNPVVAGDQLVIFGRLRGPNAAHRVVTLWHRINPRPFFTPVGRTTTDANGFYAFFRQSGVVDSNRNWYVRSLGARSRTVHERVFSLVTLSGPADGSNLLTGPAHAMTFTGTASPFTVGDTVLLQRQNGDSGKGWNTIDRTRVRPGGTFSFAHTFRVPGDANIRALVKATRRNLASASSVLGYQISQAQNPQLTLNSSADPIAVGQPVTLSGKLNGGGGQMVTLLAATHGAHLAPVAQTVAGKDGDYSFTQVPLHNAIYQVKGGSNSSAQLFEGVKDLLTATETPSTVAAGQTVTFSGTVAPAKSGHVIYLQRQNANGNGFHTVQVGTVGPGSVYSIASRLFVPGTKVFRVLIPGGPFNQGAASQPFTVTVTQPPASQLNGSKPDADSQGG